MTTTQTKAGLLIGKLSDASQQHGRGSDNKRIPARYGISYNGKLVGTIVGKPQRHYDISEWTVYKIVRSEVLGSVRTIASYLPIKSMLRSRKAAIAWVQANDDEFID